MTCCGRLFQVRVTRKARLLTMDSRVRRRDSDNEGVEWPRDWPCSSLDLIGKVVRCCLVQTLVHKNSELELDLLWCCQPLQMLEEWSDVVIPRRREHKLSVAHLAGSSTLSEAAVCGSVNQCITHTILV